MTSAIDRIMGGTAGTTAGAGAATGRGKSSAAADDDSDPMARIRDIGFAAYVKEIQEKKIEEMRKQILSRMGLDEEKLAAMPADARSKIEQAVNDEIKRRLMAQSAVNDQNGQSFQPAAGQAGAFTPANMLLNPGGSGTAQGLLLALQDVENRTALDGSQTDGRADPRDPATR